MSLTCYRHIYVCISVLLGSAGHWRFFSKVFSMRYHPARYPSGKGSYYLKTHCNYKENKIYCHVSGVPLTNNDGFWIEWLDLLTLLLQSILITINYSPIANLPISQITRTCSILVFALFCPLLSCTFDWTLLFWEPRYIASGGPNRKHHFLAIPLLL
jgi:hypothetical protein